MSEDIRLCKTCQCCPATICESAIELHTPCNLTGSYLVPGGANIAQTMCPCPAPSILRYRLGEAMAIDPSHPSLITPMPPELINSHYARRAGALIEAVHAARLAGFPAGIVHNPTEPDWPLLVIELPTGQVTWHMQAAYGDTEDPLHLYVTAARIPKLDVFLWDGHDTSTKYQRVTDWINLSSGQVPVDEQEQSVTTDFAW